MGKRSEPSAETEATTGPSISATASSAATESPARVRLLLHCVDGVFPYLTPHLLERCFPPQQVQPWLLLGLAVRDTCVAPLYSEKKNITASGFTTKKVRGYTFSATTKPDVWLLPYQRVTVPTFDLVQDARNAAQQTKKRPIHNANGPEEDKDNDASSIYALMNSTKEFVQVWTCNGRVALTPQLYHGSANGLQSHIQVPLFDTILPYQPPSPPKGTTIGSSSISEQHSLLRRHRKQAATAVTRTQIFLNQFMDSSIMEGQEQTSVWMPLLVDMDSTTPTNGPNYHQLEWLRKHRQTKSDNNSKCTVTGVALVGWHAVENASDREKIVDTIATELIKTQPPIAEADPRQDLSVAVLTTRTLQQILQIAAVSSGGDGNGIVAVIGTDLPTVWAQSKKAFVVTWKKAIQQPSPEDDAAPEASSAKKQRTEPAETTAATTPAAHILLDINGCAVLHVEDGDDEQPPPTDHPWFRDERPLVEGCQCWTCRTHSRAYIYHLVCAKEILAEILLFVHNLHHLLELIKELDERKKRGLSLTPLQHSLSSKLRWFSKQKNV